MSILLKSYAGPRSFRSRVTAQREKISACSSAQQYPLYGSSIEPLPRLAGCSGDYGPLGPLHRAALPGVARAPISLTGSTRIAFEGTAGNPNRQTEIEVM